MKAIYRSLEKKNEIISASSTKASESSKTSRKGRVKLFNLILGTALILLAEGLKEEVKALESKIYYCFP
jgi:hypothetical protein